MIAGIYKEGNDIEARTTGCSCCSYEFVINEETSTDERQVIRDEILDELKDNLRVLENACDILGIDIDELRERS